MTGGVKATVFDGAQVVYCKGAVCAGYFSGAKKIDRVKAYKLFDESARLFLDYDGESRRGVREFTDTLVCMLGVEKQ